jgi:hypothetical protein
MAIITMVFIDLISAGLYFIHTTSTILYLFR